MAFTIVTNMVQPGPSMFYEPKFRHILELHIPNLRTIYATRQPITPDELYQFEGDFHGFLLSKGHLLETHWLYTRLNGMKNPMEFGWQLRDPNGAPLPSFYVIPHPEAIAELQQYYLQMKK